MPKVMLVEDDNNLREIYEARLLAEGYEIVSAQDGEEALALAVKEKPDLIVADIMMPKISGFDMLDILRSTPETKDTKIIMMTALSQAEDKERASKLGADRYLVKSQVTLEDVARVAREVLAGGSGDKPAASPSDPASPPSTNQPSSGTPSAGSSDSTQSDNQAADTGSTLQAPATDPPTTPTENQIAKDEQAITLQIHNPSDTSTPIPAQSNTQATDTVASTTVPISVATPPDSQQSSSSDKNDAVLADAMSTVNGGQAQPVTAQAGGKHSIAVADESGGATGTEVDSKTVIHTKTINPINDLSKQSANFQELIAKEEAKDNLAQTAHAVAAHQATVAEVSGKPERPDDSVITTITPTQAPDPNSIAL